MLAVTHFEGEHTGEKISEKLRLILAEWKIDAKICQMFVTDDAYNFKKVKVVLNVNF